MNHWGKVPQGGFQSFSFCLMTSEVGGFMRFQGVMGRLQATLNSDSLAIASECLYLLHNNQITSNMQAIHLLLILLIPIVYYNIHTCKSLTIQHGTAWHINIESWNAIQPVARTQDMPVTTLYTKTAVYSSTDPQARSRSVTTRSSESLRFSTCTTSKDCDKLNWKILSAQRFARGRDWDLMNVTCSVLWTNYCDCWNNLLVAGLRQQSVIYTGFLRRFLRLSLSTASRIQKHRYVSSRQLFLYLSLPLSPCIHIHIYNKFNKYVYIFLGHCLGNR